MQPSVLDKPNSAFQAVKCPVCDNETDFDAIPGSRTDNWIRKLDIGLSRSLWAICKRCGLVMQNPRPNAEIYKRLYEGSVYHEHQVSDTQIQRSIDLIEYCFAEKIGFAERFYKGRALTPWRVLDIGCGMGESLYAFRDRGFEPYGVQPDPELTRLAKSRLGLDLTEGYFSAETFPENHFSVVFTNHAFEHFDDPLAVVQGIAKVLKPGGVCFTCVPTFQKNKTMTGRAWMNSAHNWIFTHHTLGALFERAGLRPLAHTYGGTSKYTDELWLVVEKPADPASPSSVRHETPPSWKKVRRDIFFSIPLRSALYLPWIYAHKAVRFVKFTGGRPSDVLRYLAQIARTNGAKFKLWRQSFSKPDHSEKR